MRTIQRLTALSVFSISACSQAPNTASLTHDLVVHEWGTYTSVQSSEARTMIGLHHAEELLPNFVHARAWDNPEQKGVGDVDFAAEPVTQKLETPVLYFYGAPGHATVDVQFPSGLISEWYPNAASYAPAVGQGTQLASGTMRWELDLVSDEGFNPVAVPNDSVWAPSRQVAASGIRIGGEDEKFIFYRGLARFERPVRVRSSEGVTVANDSSEEIPAAFLLRVEEDGGTVIELGAIPAHGETTATLDAPLTPYDDYLLDARTKVAAALEATGLYADEARAMVDTWTHSYFGNPGTRVLYVAPRAWTDELLPITIAPQPKELVRTLVGRIEVITAAEEQTIARDLTEAAAGRKSMSFDAYGRFTEPKLRRAIELVTDPQVRTYAQGLIDQAFSMP